MPSYVCSNTSGAGGLLALAATLGRLDRSVDDATRVDRIRAARPWRPGLAAQALHLAPGTDHVVPYAQGGPTTADNLEGVCEACTYAKEAPGWSSRVTPGVTHTVDTTTPTGHVYRSGAPPLPGTQRPGIRQRDRPWEPSVSGGPDLASVVERWLADQVRRAASST